MKYKIFTNDCGSGLYSCFADIEAQTLTIANDIAKTRTRGLSNGGRKVRVVVVRESLVNRVFVTTLKGLKIRR